MGIDVSSPHFQRAWARTIAQAWCDEDFRSAFQADPAGVLREQGADISDDVELSLSEEPLASLHQQAFEALPPAAVPQAAGFYASACLTLCLAARAGGAEQQAGGGGQQGGLGAQQPAGGGQQSGQPGFTIPVGTFSGGCFGQPQAQAQQRPAGFGTLLSMPTIGTLTIPGGPQQAQPHGQLQAQPQAQQQQPGGGFTFPPPPTAPPPTFPTFGQQQGGPPQSGSAQIGQSTLGSYHGQQQASYGTLPSSGPCQGSGQAPQTPQAPQSFTGVTMPTGGATQGATWVTMLSLAQGQGGEGSGGGEAPPEGGKPS
jgi:hypothetical protein